MGRFSSKTEYSFLSKSTCLCLVNKMIRQRGEVVEFGRVFVLHIYMYMIWYIGGYLNAMSK